MTLYPSFARFWEIWMKFCTRDLHTAIFSNCEFHENRLHGSSTSLKSVNKNWIHPFLVPLSSDMVTFRHTRWLPIFFDLTRKCTAWKLYFIYGRKLNYAHLLVYRETAWHYGRKERLGEVCVLRHEERRLSDERQSSEWADEREGSSVPCSMTATCPVHRRTCYPHISSV